jgi:hypothetical protein
VSDTAALYQALGGGWWNRIQPPAPEQKFDVATEQSKPVVDYPDWLADLWANIAHNWGVKQNAAQSATVSWRTAHRLRYR